MVIWLALEINTLSFCTIAAREHGKRSKPNKEAAIKYFIIQSVASAILVLYLSFQKERTIIKTLFFAGTAAILVKLAAAPFHSWFLEVIKKSSFTNRIILITWQKLAPIYLLMFILKPLTVGAIFLSTLIGRIIQMYTKTFIEIIALSSVFNLGWMIMAVLARSKTLIAFTVLYWMSILLIIVPIIKINITEGTKDVSMNVTPWVTMMVTATLAGLPPSIGFIAKWAVVTQALKTGIIITVTRMLILSTVNFYIYLRTTLTTITSQFSFKQKQQKKTTQWTILVAAIINIPLLPMVRI